MEAAYNVYNDAQQEKQVALAHLPDIRFCQFCRHALIALNPLPYTPSALLCETKAAGSVS